ncbi:hypothetical protein DPMN_111891 [Dreissena polymorpha]|uniref:Receptor ligand binding region domain-containing protein n=1 Tax=Dreissena polymorpha TaxID=45954 RepID=A0A9D4KG16_DREPO|nr:hypothetical protein DPMN_111891 [Dreissena polymorpha]
MRCRQDMNLRGCTPSVATISRMAVAWSVPHFTYVGMDVSLNNKREFSLLTRMSYTLNAFAKFYLEVFDAFGWTDIANIYDPDEYLSNLIGTSFQASFQALAIHIHSSEIHLRQKTEDIQSEILRVIRKASSVSRVFIVVCHGDVFRQMVLMASEILPLGDYVFIFFFQFSGDFPIGEYHWARGDLLDQTARKAYESVMVIRPRRPVTAEFEHFEKEVKRRSPIEYNYTWQDGHEVSLFNIAQYDSFILYALALNETLAAGENPRNGPIVVRRMWNRTFEGIGGPAYVNANGDRDTDFTLLDLNPNNGEFQAI